MFLQNLHPHIQLRDQNLKTEVANRVRRKSFESLLEVLHQIRRYYFSWFPSLLSSLLPNKVAQGTLSTRLDQDISKKQSHHPI